MHNLLHLCDDYETFGPLDDCSAFRFENHMQQIKKVIRSTHKPLEQLVHRYSEILNKEGVEMTRQVNDSRPKRSCSHSDGPLLNNFNSSRSQFSKLIFPNLH